MAIDVLPPTCEYDRCPWCNKPVLVEHQTAVYADGESEQYLGIKRGTEQSDPDYGLQLKPEIEETLRYRRYGLGTNYTYLTPRELRIALGIGDTYDGY